jgi:hypothetical protein
LDHKHGELRTRDWDGDCWWKAALGAPSIDDLTDGSNMDGVALKCLDEGFLKLSRAGDVEQSQQACCRAAEISVALRDDAQKGLRAAAGGG